MISRPPLLLSLARLITATVLGILGGAICGVAILSFGDVIGRSGDTGSNYLGYWNTASVWLGLLYGGIIGVFVAPVGYIAMARKVGIRCVILPAALGTLVGGFLGSFGEPLLAAVTGIIGFFSAIGWAVARSERTNQSRGLHETGHNRI